MRGRRPIINLLRTASDLCGIPYGLFLVVFIPSLRHDTLRLLLTRAFVLRREVLNAFWMFGGLVCILVV